jgi:hypothetical protein
MKDAPRPTDSEEIFLTLLQRVQRQYTAADSSHTQQNHHHRQQLPPDEAASAVGRQLALAFQSVVEDKGMVRKGIQEKAMMGLSSNRYLNPSVTEAFFSTLIALMSTPRQALVSLEFLPTWILHCEQVILEESLLREDSILSSFDGLTTTIRAYASYKQRVAAAHSFNPFHSKTTLTATHAHSTLAAGATTTTATTTTNNNNNINNEANTTNGSANDPNATTTTSSGLAIVDSQQIAFTYRRLQSSTSRVCMAREFTKAAFYCAGDNNNNNNMEESLQIRPLLSPLMAASVLSLTTPIHESTFFLEGLWRECWAELGMVEEGGHFPNCFDLLLWMTTSLDYFLLGIPCRPSVEERLACKELGFRWLIQLLEMGSFLVQSVHDEIEVAPPPHHHRHQGGGSGSLQLSRWLVHILGDTVPALNATIPSYRISLQPALAQILGMVQRMTIPHRWMQLDPVTTLRLATLAISNPIKEDVRSLLRILTTSLPIPSSGGLEVHVQAIIKAVGSMFVRDELCRIHCKELLHSLAVVEQSSQYGIASTTNSERTGGSGDGNSVHSHSLKGIGRTLSSGTSTTQRVTNSLQFLDPSIVNVHDFLTFLSRPNSLATTNWSAFQQNAALLLGIGLLKNKQGTTPKTAFLYLKQLLARYSHLGISLLPVLMDSINTASIRGDGMALVQQLEFLCDTVVLDVQCAREIWNLIGVELMRETTPSVIRATVIRLFPKLCTANRRLYKRIIDALGRNLASSSTSNAEVRLAIAATIAELAQEDQIRDVTDVIGWIQGFIVDVGWIRRMTTLDDELAPSNASIVHYAIMALHYLVVAQELDFHLVIVVLNKRLCTIHNIDDVLKLPHIVLEALAILLGDGECDEDSDEEQSTSAALTVQVTRSVETLIQLGLAEKMRLPKSADTSAYELEWAALRRCRRNIYESLLRYSMPALGIDDDGIRAVAAASESAGDNINNASSLPRSGVRYEAVRHLIQDGMQILASDDPPFRTTTPEEVKELEEKNSKALGALTSKLLQFEEEVFGSNLWQKRGKLLTSGSPGKVNRNNVNDEPTVEPLQLAALPSSTMVQQVYTKNQSTATSLAVLLCFDGKPLSLLTDLAGDIANESLDPMMLVFTVQAWLNAARHMLIEMMGRSSAQGLDQILREIREWRFRMDSPDNMYMALIALALHIPDTLGRLGDHSGIVEEVCNEVWHAYSEHEFDSADIGQLCLGFVGICDVRTRNFKRLDDIVTTLEKSVSGYGGQASFGSFYALSSIAQALPVLSTPGRFDEADIDLEFISRIIGFLVNELVSCIRGEHKALRDLVSGIHDGEISPEIVAALTTFRKMSLHLVTSKRRTAKSLFIGFALCLPSLASINYELLLGVYCLLESLEWGSGKGIALPSVLRACRKCRLFDSQEIEKIYGKYARDFEEGINLSIDGLDDIFYAVTATMKKAIPYNIRRFLVGNRTLFDEEGRAMSVLAAVVSLSSMPCLGVGADLITDTARLSPTASKDDVLGVVELVAEGAKSRDWNQYSQVSVLLMGFMASMNKLSDDNRTSFNTRPKEALAASSMGDSNGQTLSKLPTAQQGTVLDVVMSILAHWYHNPNGLPNDKAKSEVVRILGCMEVLSLPGHFATFVEQMLHGTDEVKAACVRLLVSQIRGRRRAVFDGREFVALTVKVATTPVSALRTLLGQGDAPIVFIESMADILPKFPPDAVEEAFQNMWRLCINQVGNSPAWTLSFLSTVQMLLKTSRDKKSISMSPNIMNFVRLFVLNRIFAGIRDAPLPSSSVSSDTDQRTIIDVYTQCLMEIPIPSLVEAEFFALKELDGFVGEALRNRCIMALVKWGYFTTPSRASSEISSSLAWFSRQLISSEDEIFSSSLLQVACAIAEATSAENPDRKREALLALLDNLLLTGSSACSIGLQLLSALVAQWCDGIGSDGDLSLACLCVDGMSKWQALSPPTLQQMFRLLVHDLPYNLATYSRREKISGVVFNRLLRVYNKWWEQGADQETIDTVRKTLITCRSVDSGADDFALLATAMLL